MVLLEISEMKFYIFRRPKVQRLNEFINAFNQMEWLEEMKAKYPLEVIEAMLVLIAYTRKVES